MKLAHDAVDSPMLVGNWTCSASEDGTITLSKDIESIEQVDRWRGLGRPRAAVDRRWHAPGFVFQYYVLPDGEPRWLLRCSMLIPAFAFAIMAAVFAFRCRRIQKRLAAFPSSVAAEPKI
jgi:hypothetical protein